MTREDVLSRRQIRVPGDELLLSGAVEIDGQARLIAAPFLGEDDAVAIAGGADAPAACGVESVTAPPPVAATSASVARETVSRYSATVASSAFRRSNSRAELSSSCRFSRRLSSSLSSELS